jgi:hypothetical protein
MFYSNKEGVKKLRMALMLSGASGLLTMTVFLFMETFTPLAILAGLFFAAIVLTALLNFQFVRIVIERDKLNVSYYSLFFSNREYRTFEFPLNALHNVKVTKYFPGLKWEVRFTVRTKKGLADFPSISLSAVPFRQRSKLVKELKNLILQKHPS